MSKLENTKETPGPFDAYSTLKPGEPFIALQGGDPTSSPLVMAWAVLARFRAGILPIHTAIEDLLSLLDPRKFEQATADAEKQELRLRASSAEEVAWAMDAYRKNQPLDSNEGEAYEQSRRVERPHSAEDDDALNKLLRHKEQNRLARKIHNSIAEVNEVYEALKADPAIQPAVTRSELVNLNQAIASLRFAVIRIEPHRS